MKPLRYTLIALAAACGFASAQTTAYTTPVGYVTEPLAPNAFTFLGLTLHQSTASAGVITAAGANYVDVGTTDWTAILTAGATYILELPNGTIQEITAWNNAGRLTTPENISGQVTPGTTQFKLRKAATISDVFGAENSAGLTPDSDGDYVSGNDLIYVPTGGGIAIVYYYDDGETTGWFDADGNEAANLPLVYADGFYVRRVAGSAVNLVVTGEVKTVPTSGVLAPGWNYLSSVAPVGLTVGTSGLQNFITPDTEGDYLKVDNLYVTDAGTVKIIYYYNDGETAGWFDADGNEAQDVPLEGDFLLLNRGVTKPYTVSVPGFYSTL